ncbi:MAG: recombination mediator RecR [Propionibacteriaceae bacterium]|nr:recombination mediator RecR [Propionibacteriaceae bacterium]
MFDAPIQDLIGCLGRLPGIGPKSAQRIAFFLLDCDPQEVTDLAQAIIQAKEKVSFCSVCFNATQDSTCRICQDPRRDPHQICVVEESKDIIAIERTREFHGTYHVLGGAISPIDNRGPADLHIKELVQRLSDGVVTEIILATNPNTEGEVTATYVARLLAPLDIHVSRLASGLPVGGDLEYADEITLGRAFEGRRTVEGPTTPGS